MRFPPASSRYLLVTSARSSVNDICSSKPASTRASPESIASASLRSSLEANSFSPSPRDELRVLLRRAMGTIAVTREVDSVGVWAAELRWSVGRGVRGRGCCWLAGRRTATLRDGGKNRGINWLSSAVQRYDAGGEVAIRDAQEASSTNPLAQLSLVWPVRN